MHQRHRRQTDDRQTDGIAIAYSERERKFTSAKNHARVIFHAFARTPPLGRSVWILLVYENICMRDLKSTDFTMNSITVVQRMVLWMSTGGAVLLDDVHDTSRHAGDATDARPPRPRHRQADRRGHHEEVRPRGQVPDRRPQLLAAHQTACLGTLRRTVLLTLRQGTTGWPISMLQRGDWKCKYEKHKYEG